MQREPALAALHGGSVRHPTHPRLSVWTVSSQVHMPSDLASPFVSSRPLLPHCDLHMAAVSETRFVPELQIVKPNAAAAATLSQNKRAWQTSKQCLCLRRLPTCVAAVPPSSCLSPLTQASSKLPRRFHENAAEATSTRFGNG